MIKIISTLSLISILFLQCTPAPRYFSESKSGSKNTQKTTTRRYSSSNHENKKSNDIYYNSKDQTSSSPPSLNTTRGDRAVFTASYYGKKFHGQKTSNGEVFDMYSYSAAHKELPFGTVLKVTYPKTGKSVMVKINDRGPFVKNRDLDLSYGAAKRIGLAKDGVGQVKVEIIKFGN